MAKSKKPLPAPPRPPIFKAVLLVLACALAGGAIVYKYGPALRKAARDAREQGLGRPAQVMAGTKKGAGELKPALPEQEQAAPPAPDAKLAKLNRTELEREVQRLREAVERRDRENSELKIQLKILRDGSRSER